MRTYLVSHVHVHVHVRVRVRLHGYVCAVLIVGLSSALPIFLLMHVRVRVHLHVWMSRGRTGWEALSPPRLPQR